MQFIIQLMIIIALIILLIGTCVVACVVVRTLDVFNNTYMGDGFTDVTMRDDVRDSGMCDTRTATYTSLGVLTVVAWAMYPATFTYAVYCALLCVGVLMVALCGGVVCMYITMYLYRNINRNTPTRTRTHGGAITYPTTLVPHGAIKGDAYVVGARTNAIMGGWDLDDGEWGTFDNQGNFVPNIKEGK